MNGTQDVVRKVVVVLVGVRVDNDAVNMHPGGMCVAVLDEIQESFFISNISKDPLLL